MAIYSVCYDLHDKDSENYQKIYDAVDKIYNHHHRILESMIILTTDKSISEVNKTLSSVFEKDDDYIIFELSKVGGCYKNDEWTEIKNLFPKSFSWYNGHY